MRNGVTIPNGPGASTRESLSTSGSDDNSAKKNNVNGNGDLQI